MNLFIQSFSNEWVNFISKTPLLQKTLISSNPLMKHASPDVLTLHGLTYRYTPFSVDDIEEKIKSFPLPFTPEHLDDFAQPFPNYHHVTLFHRLSMSSFIHPDFIKQHLDKPWDYQSIPLDMELVELLFQRQLHNATACIQRNPNLTLDMMYSRPDLPWDWKSLSANPHIPLHELETHIHEIPIEVLSSHPSMTLSFIKEHPDILRYHGDGICFPIE